MAAELHFWHPSHLADAKGRLTWRHVNILNAPVVSSTWLANGAAVADVYELVFNKSGSVVSCTVTALIHGAKNPHQNLSGIVVTADGSTVNNVVVPGVGLVFSAATDTGWKARISVGNFLNDDGSYERFFGYGIVEEGATSTSQRVAVRNIGADDAANTAVYSCPGLHWSGTNATQIVKRIGPHTNVARHKLATPGTYSITFADFKDDPGGSGKKICDVIVNGNLAINDALMDGATVYQYGVAGYDDASDRLRGLHIVLQDTTLNPVGITVTLVVASSGYTYVQFAADAGGSPGPYAYQDLTLTESGKPTGTITSGGAAFFWHRLAPPEGAGPGAIRAAIPRIRCLSI